MENHTAKHFVLQLGSLASLYVSLSFLLILLFAVINLLVPDATDSSWQIERNYTSARLGIACVFVFFPTYLILTRIVNRTRRQQPDGKYLGLTKWLIYLSLLVGGAALLGDLVAVILAFLEGEITLRFILKALSVLVVVGAAFAYYILDARGYWLLQEGKSKSFGLVAASLVAAIIVTGFFIIEGPNAARERALDEEQIRDLQGIQADIQRYLDRTGEVPNSQNELPGNITNFDAPEDREDYTYERTEGGFALCATFATASRDEDRAYVQPFPHGEDGPTIYDANDWEHKAGRTCFSRTVE